MSGGGLVLETQDPNSSSDPVSDGGADAGANGADAASSDGGMDVMVVLESIARGTYQTSPAFKQVTQEPYPSVAAPGSNVSEWVSTASWYQYIAISPGVTGSLVTLPAGTTIVRAVLNEDGGVAKLTLMYKGPAGFNPALGDWWFAVTDPDGLPLESDGGAEEGKLTGCYSCHIPRSEDGFVFGVPLDDRVAGGTPSAP